MKNLLTLLERFSRSLNKDSSMKSAVAKVIFDQTRVKLLPDEISLKEGVLKITASASAKNEINLKEDAIKDELKGTYDIFIIKVFYK